MHFTVTEHNPNMSLSSKLSIEDVDLKGKRVLIRVDFNVPLDSDKKVTNPQRYGGIDTYKARRAERNL